MTRAEFLARARLLISEAEALSATTREAAEASALRVSRTSANVRQDAADTAQVREQVARSLQSVLRPSAW
jgi:hypothetical protein